jgi:hypothetical protein
MRLSYIYFISILLFQNNNIISLKFPPRIGMKKRSLKTDITNNVNGIVIASSTTTNQLDIQQTISTSQLTTSIEIDKTSTYSFNYASAALAAWGVLGVVSVILNALKRLFPIAIQPFIQKDMDTFHWVAYGLWVMYMIYAEGYKAFHLKFSPFIVKRAILLYQNPSIVKCLLAGPYCMGLFSATKTRLMISWGITIGVFGLVSVVKILPYPWRSIIDGGVVAGLSVGTLSTLWHFIMALLGKIPDIDACLV